jgi:hypothetical protein
MIKKLSPKMTPAEFREIQQKIGLNNTELGSIFGVSGRAIAGYRTDIGKTDHRPIPGPLAVAMRIYIEYQQKKIRNRNAQKKYALKNPDKIRESQSKWIKKRRDYERPRKNSLSPDEIKIKKLEYNCAYQRMRRTGDFSLLEDWREKWQKNRNRINQ